MSKLYCELCRNQYNDNKRMPIILPCNHVFCKHCLGKKKNKNIFFCQKCNKNVILTNLRPNQKILKKLKEKNRENRDNYSSQNENEENEDNEDQEEQEEEEGEEVEDDENEEGEEEEDDDENDKIVEENSESEIDNSEVNDKKTVGSKKLEQKNLIKEENLKDSIIAKKSNLKRNKKNYASQNEDDSDSKNSYDSKNRTKRNSQNNKLKRQKSKFVKNSSQEIDASRVNFTSENSSQESQEQSSNSKVSNIEENIDEEKEEDKDDENNYDNNRNTSNEKNKKVSSSRKGTYTNRNSLNKKKDYNLKNEEESESIPSLENNDFCVKHKDKMIEFFCSDCTCAICSLCIYETHNGHKLSLLDDISGIIKKKMGEFFTRIQDIIKLNKDNRFNWQKRKDEVNDYLKQQISLVTKSFKEIISKLEEKKNMIIKEFRNKYNHEFNRFDQIKVAIENDGKEMEKINNLIDNKIKLFNTTSDAKILKEIEKYKKIFRQTGLDCGKLQKNEIAIKSELNIDPAMKPMTVNINGLIELLNKVDAKNICYPKVLGNFKDDIDNTSSNQQKNIGKNDYNQKFSHSSSFTGVNNFNNYKGNEEKKFQNEMDNKLGINQSYISNMRKGYSTSNKYIIENIPGTNLKYRNYNKNNNYRLSQNDLNDSNYGEYGPPNHNRGKFVRQLDLTPTATFVNVKRSSKYGQIYKNSNNSIPNMPNNNINNLNGKNYNGNYNDNITMGEGIFKENGFGSHGSDYSNHNNNNNYNYNNNNKTIYNNQNNFFKRQRNNSFGSIKENNYNNDSILQRKNNFVLKERNPSAGLPLKLNDDNAIILPKISPFPQNNKESSNQNISNLSNLITRNNINKNNMNNINKTNTLNTVNNSDSEKSDNEDSIFCFGEANYCLKFYLKKQEWELIPYTSQLSRQLGLLRYSGVCSLPSYRIIISGGCKKETDEPSNLFFLINSKNINDIKNLKNLPKKKYFHGCLFLNNNIYIIGGYDHYDRTNAIPSTLKTVERYNLSKKQWQNLHGLNEARACFGQCIFNGQIFVFGGLYNGSTLQTIERYDEESNVWSLYHIKLPMKLAKAGIINIDNKNIFVIGGSDENLVPVNNVFSCKFDSDDDKDVWSRESELICPRTTGNTCFLWKKCIFVMGGSSTNFLEKYDFNNKKWETFDNFFSVIKSSSVETVLTNYSCALNHYSTYL